MAVAAGFTCPNVQKCPDGYLPMTLYPGLNIFQFHGKFARLHRYTEWNTAHWLFLERL